MLGEGLDLDDFYDCVSRTLKMGMGTLGLLEQNKKEAFDYVSRDHVINAAVRSSDRCYSALYYHYH